MSSSNLDDNIEGNCLGCARCWNNMSRRSKISACVGLSGVLLLVILVPFSLRRIEYYEYGILMRKSTGRVDFDTVYTNGRHLVGPDHKFLIYRADAHHVILDDMAVFSSGGGSDVGNNNTTNTTSNDSVGIEFKIDVDFTFLLIKDRVGQLHKDLASSYEIIITSRARDAIKNEAATVKTTDYFQSRQSVEDRFRTAVTNNWNSTPILPCILDQFHLGRINISDAFAEKLLQSRIQNERNEMEASIQKAAIERELTAVEVNSIGLQKEKLLRTAQAEAKLLRARATAEASRIVQEAQINGTNQLFQAVDSAATQEHMTAYTYIRTLMNRDNVSLGISYLSADNILRTSVVP